MRALNVDNFPFFACKEDTVTSAGSLSYGDNQVVMDEIHRVLKPGGNFICVDSLSHNPIYRFNRWWHYKKGNRSRSTLKRMPTIWLLDRYQQKFGKSTVQFFGSISWAAPLLKPIMSNDKIACFTDWFDQKINVKNLSSKRIIQAVVEHPGLVKMMM